MSLPFVFSFAPVPLTDELSPLAHAAALARRRQSETQDNAKPRYRIQSPSEKKTVVVALS